MQWLQPALYCGDFWDETFSLLIVILKCWCYTEYSPDLPWLGDGVDTQSVHCFLQLFDSSGLGDNRLFCLAFECGHSIDMFAFRCHRTTSRDLYLYLKKGLCVIMLFIVSGNRQVSQRFLQLFYPFWKSDCVWREFSVRAMTRRIPYASVECC